MKKIVILSMSTLVFFFSCKKEPIPLVEEIVHSSNGINISDGYYVGSFTRTSGSQVIKSSAVTLDLHDAQYNGTSSEGYPAMCLGGFSIQGKQISIVNTCHIPLDYDRSYIFGGTYNYVVFENTLTIWRINADGTKDTYFFKPGLK